MKYTSVDKLNMPKTWTQKMHKGKTHLNQKSIGGKKTPLTNLSCKKSRIKQKHNEENTHARKNTFRKRTHGNTNIRGKHTCTQKLIYKKHTWQQKHKGKPHLHAKTHLEKTHLATKT